MLSEKVPVAVNCWVRPLAIAGLAGVTAIDCRVAAVTVRTVEPVTPESVAVMSRSRRHGGWPGRLLEMVATAVVAEAQVTWLVRSWVELSE